MIFNFSVPQVIQCCRCCYCLIVYILDIPAPDIMVNADLTSVSVSWSKPEGVDEVSYLLTLSGGGFMTTINTKSLQHSFADLEMGTEYTINASTVQKKGGQGKPISKVIRTGKKDKSEVLDKLIDCIILL